MSREIRSKYCDGYCVYRLNKNMYLLTSPAQKQKHSSKMSKNREIQTQYDNLISLY